MAKVYQSQSIANGANGYPEITSSGAHDLVAVTERFAVSAAIEIGDVFEAIVLPPGYVPVDVILDTDDLDSGSTLTLTVGILDGDVGDTTVANRTNGAEFIVASNVGQAGGVARANVAGFTGIEPSDKRRSIGVTAAAAATGAEEGELRLTVLYRPQIHGA